MIIEIRVENCFVFDKEISFSMNADMRNKKFASNVHTEDRFNILKTAGVYGANNAGKTCLVKCIRAIKQILSNTDTSIMPNIFTQNTVCKLGVTFLADGRIFSIDIKLDMEKKEFIYEAFSEIHKDRYGNEKREVLLLRDMIHDQFSCVDKDAEKLLPLMSKNNLLLHLIDTDKFKHLDEMKKIMIGFADKIDIISMNNIPMSHTIELMKNRNHLQKRIVDFIKKSDIHLDDFKYIEMDKIKVEVENENPEEDVLNIPETIMDRFRLVSTYKGVDVPSLLFDSTGTKKIAALASYVIEGLEQGRILIVDELDSSLHFKLTRAIVNLFNNELNDKAQMIFTIHDINLIDCKRMFRKEQIWFVHKDENGVFVYSLADFTASDGVRDTSDNIEKYKKGVFGAIPEPDLIHSLLDMKGKKGGLISNGEKNSVFIR